MLLRNYIVLCVCVFCRDVHHKSEIQQDIQLCSSVYCVVFDDRGLIKVRHLLSILVGSSWLIFLFLLSPVCLLYFFGGEGGGEQR